jgi:hypothetical protein
MASKVEVTDHQIWIRHVHGDAALKARLERLEPGALVTLRVNGIEGVWRKMDGSRTSGLPTPGLRPLGKAGEAWRELYRRFGPKSGELVEITVAVDEADLGTAPGSAVDGGSQAAFAERTRARWHRGSGIDREAVTAETGSGREGLMETQMGQRAASVTIWEPAGTLAEREAAWQAFLRAARESKWRSNGPYGPRDELYDRDEP